MFRPDQIISPTELIRHFSDFSRLLSQSPQPLLIIQKGRDKLVLVNAEIFSELLEFKLSWGPAPDQSALKA